MRVTLVAAALVLSTLPVWASGPTLAERGAAIERASNAPDGFRVVVGHISRELGVPVDALRAQRLRSGFDWGGIFIANRLAKETGMSFDEVVAAYRAGQSWEAIVQEHKIDLEKLTAAIERSRTVVERRAEDKAPPPMEWKSNAEPGTGGPSGFMPGIMPSAPVTTPGRTY